MIIAVANLDELVARYRAGDSSVRNEIVEQLMPLARQLTGRLARQYPNRKMDLKQVAYTALVQAVVWAQTRLYDNNIAPYVNVTIRRFLQEFILEDRLIPVSRSAQESLRDELRTEGYTEEEVAEHMWEKMMRYAAYSFIDPHNSEDHTSDEAPDLVSEDQDRITRSEIIMLLGLSDNELQVVSLREQGYTLREIGAMMNTSFQLVGIYLKRIQSRYIRVQGRHPTLPSPPPASEDK